MTQDPVRPGLRGDVLAPITLVPVQVFGGDCSCHQDAASHGGDCTGWGYGLMDAVGAGSACNRAVGHIYRVNDNGPDGWKPGETATVFVPVDQLEWFETKRDED